MLLLCQQMFFPMYFYFGKASYFYKIGKFRLQFYFNLKSISLEIWMQKTSFSSKMLKAYLQITIDYNQTWRSNISKDVLMVSCYMIRFQASDDSF